MTLAAIDSGKAVLCEKPMAMNADEARRMADRAKEKGVPGLIDHELRFLPGRLKMREMVQRGELGKIKHASVIFRADSRADPNREWNWWSDETQGGGALGAIGSHIVDGFRWMLFAEVDEVMCKLVTHIRERKDHQGISRAVTTDDEANLLLRFSDSELTEGATGNVSISMVEAGKPLHRFEVFGEHGALRVEGDGELWRANVGDSDWQRVEIDRGELAPGMNDNGWARGFTIFSKKIIDALNRVLELELAGVVRYMHYSFMIFGHNRIPIVAWLRDQGTESNAHAVLAGEHITAFGGHPSLKIGGLLETHQHDVNEILKEAHEHEKEGLDAYYALLELVAGKSILLEEYARDQIAAEEMHLADIRKMMRKPGSIK